MDFPKGASIMMRSRLAHHDAPDTDHFLLSWHRGSPRRFPCRPCLLGRGSRECLDSDRRSMPRHELLNLNGVRALDRELGELIILNLHRLVFADLVAFYDIVALNHVARDGVDVLKFDAIASLPIEPVAAHLLAI